MPAERAAARRGLQRPLLREQAGGLRGGVRLWLREGVIVENESDVPLIRRVPKQRRRSCQSVWAPPTQSLLAPHQQEVQHLRRARVPQLCGGPAGVVASPILAPGPYV